MEIEVDFRDVYGKTVAYPSCAKARTFSALTGCKTLTPEALKHIIALGYTIRIKQQPQRYEI
jgi:transposase